MAFSLRKLARPRRVVTASPVRGALRRDSHVGRNLGVCVDAVALL